MYPTPNTYDYKTNPGEDYQNWKVRAKKKKKEKGISLHFALRQAVQKEEEEKRMYPTPTARDWKDTGKNTNYEKLNKKRILSGQVMVEEKKLGGKLNPNFVEFLMGFPMDWKKTEPTESKHLETQSSHKSQEN